MHPVETLSSFFHNLNQSIDRKEKLTLYIPYHAIFWSPNYANPSSNYLAGIQTNVFSDFEIKHLLTEPLFRIVALDFSYEIAEDGHITGVQVESKTKINLLELLFHRLCPRDYYPTQNAVDGRLKRVIETFRLTFDESVPNKIIFPVNTFLNRLVNDRDYYELNNYSLTSLFKTTFIAFYTKDDATEYMLEKASKIFSNTINILKKNKKRVLLSASLEPLRNIKFYNFIASGTQRDTALLRKVLFTSYSTLYNIDAEFKKNAKALKKENRKITCDQLNKIFDYTLWNKTIKDVFVFERYRSKEDRNRYFRNCIKRNINARKRSKTSNCISQ